MPTPQNALIRKLSLQFLLLALALMIFGQACTAEDAIKQGAQGEFCNDFDDDCRSGLSCVNFVCQGLANESTCGAICERLEECGRFQDNCEVVCDNTIRQWSDQAIDDFAGCLTEDLTCEEIQEVEEPPQECYNRLALPDDRRDRCEDFIASVRSCDGSIDTEELRTECRYMARTRSEEIWSLSDECVARVEDGVCPDIFECLNTTFDLPTPLEYAP